MVVQRTLSIIKPDATRRNLTGAINQKLDNAGLRIIAQKRKKLSKVVTHQLCKQVYGETLCSFYESFKKKDDLADCLLQALDFIKKKEKLTTQFYDKIILWNELKFKDKYKWIK